MNEHDEKNKRIIVVRKSNLQQMNIQWNSDFSNLQWKQKLERKIVLLEKSEVKVECSGEEWETNLVSVIGRFQKMGVREIAISLQFKGK